MLRLIAAAWEDGYAAVADEDDEDAVFIIRPPYRRENKYRVQREAVEHAVSTHGFSVAEGTFENWGELIECLKRRFVEAHKQDGEPDGERIRRAVERAPEANVRTSLEKVEREIFPAREWNAAISLLTRLLGNPAVIDQRSLLDTVARLLRFTEAARRQEVLSRAEAAAPTAPRDEFPLVREIYGDQVAELARHIRKQGQVLCMGSGGA